MTYIELINNFWAVRRTRPMTSYEADFYFYLLKECNSRNWTSPFELPTRNIEFDLGISRKTICDLRNKLQQKGLISFKEGNKRAGSAFYEVLYVSDGNITGNISGNIKGNITGNISGNTNIKTKTKNIINNNSSELFPPAPAREGKPKKSKAQKEEFIPPTIEQVKSFFEGKLPDWEKQAEIFFYHFDSLGWKNTNGIRIERWDSRANLWIFEKQLQNGKSSKGDGGGVVSGTGRENTPEKGGNVFDLPSDELEDFINSLPIGQ